MSTYPTILICGSRDFEDYEIFLVAVNAWIAKHGAPDIVVEGCARGADSLAGHRWAPAAGIMVQHFPANWDRYGRAAGPIRNQQMLNEGNPDAVIAFTPNLRTSRGTRDMVTRSRRAGLRVWLPIKGSDDPTAR